LGIPILGGYYESRIMEDGKASTKWVGVGQINLIRHNTFHIIERLEDPSASPTWTLFVAGPRITSWGFLVPGVGYVDWKEHTKDRIYGVPTATAH
jgi:hypothetical protein